VRTQTPTVGWEEHELRSTLRNTDVNSWLLYLRDVLGFSFIINVSVIDVLSVTIIESFLSICEKCFCIVSCTLNCF
jgi:hypothetical protein